MRLALASLAAMLALACSSKPASADDKGSLGYQIEATQGPVKVKKGAAASVKVAIKPQEGAHVDPRAPLALGVKAGGNVALSKAALTHADGKELPTRALEFEVPFTAQAAGAEEIKVHADFYLCTAKICEHQLADVAVAVLVE